MQTQTEIAALTETEPYSDIDDVQETCQEILDALPEPIDINSCLEKASSSNDSDQPEPDVYPDYLQHEVQRYNELLSHIRQSLSEMLIALRGRLHMVERLEEIYTDIADDKVPSQWLQMSYPTKKPLGSYVKDLHNRIAYFRRWIDVAEPSVHWLTAFFFPQALLQWKKRCFAKKCNLNAFDVVGYRFVVTECEWDEEEAPEFEVCTFDS